MMCFYAANVRIFLTMSSVFVKKCKKGGKLTTFLTTLFLDRFVPLNPRPSGTPLEGGGAKRRQVNYTINSSNEENRISFNSSLCSGVVCVNRKPQMLMAGFMMSRVSKTPWKCRLMRSKSKARLVS